MKRYGAVIGLRPEHYEEYKRYHAAVWPEVLATIERCNIRNYTIYLREPENLLFSYFEYHGGDFEADMAAMASDQETQRWWAICMPCQLPFSSRLPTEQWTMMEEVFHMD